MTAGRVRDERGLALVLVLMASALLSALGAILVIETQTEGAVASNYRDGVAVYVPVAADLSFERPLY